MKFINDKAVMIIGLIATLVTPVLLTRNSCCEIFDFTETGQIGDTIGGITAPIVGLVSIMLLYMTLKEQQKYNTQQTVDNRISHVLAIQNDLNSLSDKTSYKYIFDGQLVSGSGIINLGRLSQTNSSFTFDYVELNGLLQSCVLARVICEQIQKFSIDLEESTKTSFESFAFCYLNSLYKFLSAIDRSNIRGDMLDSYADEEFDSEVGKLLDEISAEVEILKQELKHYKS